MRRVTVLISMSIVFIILCSRIFGCPGRCTCTGKKVQCGNAGLTVAPSVPKTTTILVLKDNKISEISVWTFNGLDNLTELNLENNQISTITVGTFNGLVNLKKLLLGRNQISAIAVGTFDGLPNLKILGLGKNQLTTLSMGLFKDLRSLTVLWLPGNGLKDMDEETFGDLINLEELYISNNRLTTISTGLFKELPSLTVLDIKNNPVVCECDCLLKYCYRSVNEKSQVAELKKKFFDCALITATLQTENNVTQTPPFIKMSLLIIIGIAIVMTVLLVTLAVYLRNRLARIQRHKRRRERESSNLPEPLSTTGLEAVHVYEELDQQAPRGNEQSAANIHIPTSVGISQGTSTQTAAYEGLNPSVFEDQHVIEYSDLRNIADYLEPPNQADDTFSHEYIDVIG